MKPYHHDHFFYIVILFVSKKLLMKSVGKVRRMSMIFLVSFTLSYFSRDSGLIKLLVTYL